VASPSLTGPRTDRLESLLRHPLLDLIEPPNLWRHWLARAGYAGTVPAPRLTFEGVQVMYAAAARGLGRALGMRPLVDPFLADGRLAIANERCVKIAGAYYLAATPEMRRQRSVQALWRWLVAEAKHC